ILMASMKLIPGFLVLIGSLLFAPFAFADNGSGNISGTVVDQNQQAVEGVTVRLNGLQTVYITDNKGKFSANNVKEGVYNLLVTGLGYKSAERQVRVTAGRTLSVTIKIESSST